jgi:hypothetical protein
MKRLFFFQRSIRTKKSLLKCFSEIKENRTKTSIHEIPDIKNFIEQISTSKEDPISSEMFYEKNNLENLSNYFKLKKII